MRYRIWAIVVIALILINVFLPASLVVRQTFIHGNGNDFLGGFYPEPCYTQEPISTMDSGLAIGNMIILSVALIFGLLNRRMPNAISITGLCLFCVFASWEFLRIEYCVSRIAITVILLAVIAICGMYLNQIVRKAK
jgi:hypothetical protein